jgi:hypothetical protein
MPKYWFRQKSLGIGATPNTWQGWTVTLVSVVLIFGVVLEAQQIADRATSLMVALSGVVIIGTATSVIGYLKTEGGWVWRGSPRANETVRGTVSNDKRREHERAAGDWRSGKEDN